MRTYHADHFDGGLQILLLSEHRLLQLLQVLGEELYLFLVHLGGIRRRLQEFMPRGVERKGITSADQVFDWRARVVEAC